MPYRSIPPQAAYGTWNDPDEVCMFVKIGVRAWRWVVRWGAGRHDFDAFVSRRDAVEHLRKERQSPRSDFRVYIADRKTGKCFCPPPKVVEEILEGRCGICKAGPAERCDAGLHS